MVLVPLFADQPLNARSVAEIGAGVALEGGPAAASTLAPVVGQVLSGSGPRTVARRIAHEMGRLPPVDGAVTALAEQVQRRRP